MNELMLTPRRPYILRAFYQWLVDNELKPHLVVDATLPNVDVPEEYVDNGQIVLNLAPQAIGNLDMGDEYVMFDTKFSGVIHSIVVPVYAVMAIYARENGAGTMFEAEPAYDQLLSDLASHDMNAEFEDEQDEAPPVRKGPPTLTVVK